jgi:hypothetical protein
MLQKIGVRASRVREWEETESIMQLTIQDFITAVTGKNTSALDVIGKYMS